MTNRSYGGNFSDPVKTTGMAQFLLFCYIFMTEIK
jgi:hypothetical protein